MDYKSVIESTSLDDIVFLCGAGISIDPPTYIPTVDHFIDSLFQEIIDSTAFSEADYKEFESQNQRPRFELLIDEISKTLDKGLSLGSLFTSVNFNKNHNLLAQLCHQGATVVTTNFDTCIENACGDKVPEKLIFRGRDLSKSEYEALTKYRIVKPHGCIMDFTNSSLVITLSTLNSLNHGFINYPRWRKALLDVFSNKLIIVLGYSGSDNFDITPILEELTPKQILWLSYSGDNHMIEVGDKSSADFNDRIKGLNNLTFLNGRIDQLAPCFSLRLSESAIMDTFDGSRISIYFNSTFSSKAKKYNLLFTILHYHGREDLIVEIIERDKIRKSQQTYYQYLRALNGIGKYSKLIKNAKVLLARNYSSSTRYRVIFLLSSAYYKSGDILNAKESADRQLSLALKRGNSNEIVESYIHLSSLLVNERKYKEAIKGYKNAKTYLDKVPDIVGDATYLWGIGTAYEGDKQTQRALSSYNQAIEVFYSLGAASAISYLHYNIGNIYFASNEAAESLEHYTKALSFSRRGQERATFEELYAISGLLKYLIYIGEKGVDLLNLLQGIESKLAACLGFPHWFEVVAYCQFLELDDFFDISNFEVLIRDRAPLSDIETEYRELLVRSSENSSAIKKDALIGLIKKHI